MKSALKKKWLVWLAVAGLCLGLHYLVLVLCRIVCKGSFSLQGFSDIHVLSETELAFRCQCSRIRTEEILSTLRDEDLEKLAEDGQAEVCCDFCGEKYHFTKEELLAIRERRSAV